MTIDTAKSVTAEFTLNEYTLTVISAHGTVTKVPDQTAYHYGDVVQLTANADAGWTFVNWSGDASGTANPVNVLINGNQTVTANYTDTTPPTLDITGATADGTGMLGDPENGYILATTNDPAIDHLIQFAAESVSSEELADEYTGLYLDPVATTVTAAELAAYYAGRGMPAEYLTYLNGAANGVNPFVFIRGASAAPWSVTLVDGARHVVGGSDAAMTVPDDFPLGTYTVVGVIEDLAGNESTVTLILKVEGSYKRPS